MLKSTLENIKVFLENKMKGTNYQNKVSVKLDSVSKDGDNDGLYLSLLRIEEETSLKPQTVYRYQDNRAVGKVTNPDICLNLYVLVSAYTKDYGTGLSLISDVIYWINTIDRKTSDSKETIGTNLLDSDVKSYKSNVPSINELSIELQSLNMEQNNSMWQTIGTRIVPAVLYKIRMLTIAEPSKEMQPVYKVETSLQNSPTLLKYRSGQELTAKEMEQLQEELVAIYVNSGNSELRIRLEKPVEKETEVASQNNESQILSIALQKIKSKDPNRLTEVEKKALEKMQELD